MDKYGEEAKGLCQFLENIPKWPKLVPIVSIHCNRRSTIGKAYGSMYNGKYRHIHQKYNTIRKLISTRVIYVDYIKSKDKILDLTIKGLNIKPIEKSSRGIGIIRVLRCL